MRTAIFRAALVATLCLGIAATLGVIEVYVVDLQGNDCPEGAGFCVPTYVWMIGLLLLMGMVALIVSTLLALIHAWQQYAWVAGIAFLSLFALSIGGTVAIFASEALHIALQGTQQDVVLYLLLALTPLPALVLSRFPLRRTPPWFMKALAPAALVSLIVAGAALVFFATRSRQLIIMPGDPAPAIVAA
ncbi:MAG TPA: hypothetical protein VGR57_08070, partial [Ktedonobacterales bacterium]|nr:hypothetical protein [Ktedonobacterales bacterium]